MVLGCGRASVGTISRTLAGPSPETPRERTNSPSSQSRSVVSTGSALSQSRSVVSTGGPSCRVSLAACSRVLEPMLVDAESADLRVERRWMEAELRRRTGWSRYASATLGERRLDHLPLACRQLVSERPHRLCRLAR